MVGEVGLEPTKAKANGFTVRPLCRSGHSPVPRLETADENAPGDPRRYPGELSGAARTPVNWKMTRRLSRPTLAPPARDRSFCDFDRAGLNLRAPPALGRATTAGVFR